MMPWLILFVFYLIQQAIWNYFRKPQPLPREFRIVRDWLAALRMKRSRLSSSEWNPSGSIIDDRLVKWGDVCRCPSCTYWRNNR